MAFPLDAQQQDFIRVRLAEQIDQAMTEHQSGHIRNVDIAIDRAYKYATILTALNAEFA